MIQRRGLHNCFEFSEQFWLLLFQVAYHWLVCEQFRELALRQHQIEHVLTVGLFNQFVLALQVAHLAHHLRHPLLCNAGR